MLFHPNRPPAPGSSRAPAEYLKYKCHVPSQVKIALSFHYKIKTFQAPVPANILKEETLTLSVGNTTQYNSTFSPTNFVSTSKSSLNLNVLLFFDVTDTG